SLGRFSPDIVPGTFRASPDGQHVAYVTNTRRTPRPVVMPWETSGPDFMGMLERKVKGEPGVAVVYDGKPQNIFDEIEGLVFSPDSRRLACVVRQGDSWRVVVDGEEGNGYDEVVGFVLSPDSRRFAYAARDGDEWRVVVDREAQDSCDQIE